MSCLVIQTKPNAEFFARDALEQRPHRGFSTFFPKIRVARRHAGRVDVVDRPFLPRYGFVLDGGRDLRKVRSTPGVSSVLLGFSALGIFKAIEEITRRMTNGYVDWNEELERKPCEARYEHGEAIRVTDGPFASFNGTFEQHLSNRQLAEVLVNIFGRQSKVTLDLSQIEKL